MPTSTGAADNSLEVQEKEGRGGRRRASCSDLGRAMASLAFPEVIRGSWGSEARLLRSLQDKEMCFPPPSAFFRASVCPLCVGWGEDGHSEESEVSFLSVFLFLIFKVLLRGGCEASEPEFTLGRPCQDSSGQLGSAWGGR